MLRYKRYSFCTLLFLYFIEVQVKASESLEAQKIQMDHLVSGGASPPEPPRGVDDVLAPSSLPQMEADVRGAPTLAGGTPLKSAATAADSIGSRASPVAKGGVQQVNANNTNKKNGSAAVGSKTQRTSNFVKRGECRECHEMGHNRDVCPQIVCLSCKKKGHMAKDCPCPECGTKGHRKFACPITVLKLAATQCFKCQGFGHFAIRCVKAKAPRAKAGGKLPDLPENSGGFELVKDALVKGTLPRQYDKQVIAGDITKDGVYAASKELEQQRLQAIDAHIARRSAALKKRVTDFEEEIRLMQMSLAEDEAKAEVMKKEILEKGKKAHAEAVERRVVLHEVTAAIRRELPKDSWLEKAKAKKVRKAANAQPEDSDEANPLVISTDGNLTPAPTVAPAVAPIAVAAPAAAPKKMDVAPAVAPVAVAAPAAAPKKDVAPAVAPVAAAAPAVSSPERKKRERSDTKVVAEEVKEDDDGDNAQSTLQEEEAATAQEEARGSTKLSRLEPVSGGVGAKEWGKEKKGGQGNSSPPTTAP